MDNSTRYVVGYDLNDLLTQISYFELNNDDPKTLVSDGENERLGIPTVLCKRKKVNQWSFGTEATRLIMNDEGAEVNKLLTLALRAGSITIDGEEFNGIDLLILFMRKSLDLLSVYVAVDQIESLVISVQKLDREMLAVLERVAAAIPVERAKILFLSYSESVYYYMLHQQSELWDPECVVFDHDGRNIMSYHMRLNHRTTPIVGMIDEQLFTNYPVPEKKAVYEDEEQEGDTDSKTDAEYEEQVEIADKRLHDMMHDFLMSRPIRSVYLLGTGFDGEWCKKTIGFLCVGRRVFQGRNMYSKGACYFGMDRLIPTKLNEDYLFLGKDKLQFNLGILMDRGAREEYIALADGGENWFDIGTEVEFILAGGSKVDLIVTPLDGKAVRTVTIGLDGLPGRPPKTTRLKMNVGFQSGSKVKVVIEDLGFGEIFPATGMKWEQETEIE